MQPPRARVHRRDLLRLRDRLRRPDAPTPAGPAGASDLLRASRPAMGSYFEVRVGAAVPGAADLAGRALDLIDRVESQLTVYREGSEVSRLNATAHDGPVAVEPGLFALLQTALDLGRETRGGYDVTTGALSLAWGFTRGPKRVPEPDALARAREATGQQHLRLDPEASTVRFDRPGLAINLGGIGKGYAVDRATDLIRSYWWPTTALIHGGRSSLYALGSPPGYFGDRWAVALRNPFDPEHTLGMLRLRNRGMGTSGASYQSFTSGGKVYGHILDPRTGAPAEGPASVTVLAPTAAEADALSTAFYLLGIDGAADYVARHPEVGALFVERGPADRSPLVRTLGLARADYSSGDA